MKRVETSGIVFETWNSFLQEYVFFLIKMEFSAKKEKSTLDHDSVISYTVSQLSPPMTFAALRICCPYQLALSYREGTK